MGIIIYKEH